MRGERKSLAQRAREAIKSTAGLAEPAASIEGMSAAAVDAFADLVEQASSDLNGAAHRLRRLAKQQKKAGAARAGQDIQGKDHGSRE